MALTGQNVELLASFQYLNERSEPVYDESLDTRVTNYVAFIGFTILVWDHLITLGDEVRFIWRGRKSIVVYLFFWNRYFTPFSFIGNFVAYFSDWSTKDCSKFVRYEGATVAIAVWVSGLMMLIRVRALYADRPKVTLSVGIVLLMEAGVFAWLLTRGEAVQHSSAVHGYPISACSMVFDPSLKFVPSLSAWVPLVYDTIVIFLTLYRCAGPVKERTASHIVRTLLKDGLLYYSVIFAVNLVLAVMIVSTPSGIKNIAAQLEQLLTVAMMSRITLSLRRKALTDPSDVDSYLYPRSMDTQSFHVNYVHHASDKASQHWIEHAAGSTGLSQTQDSCASSGWRCNAGLSRDSFDLDATVHSETPSVFPARRNQNTYPPRVRSSDALSRDASNLELGGPAEPEQAVLSDRDAYELRALRASPHIRQ